MSLIPFAADSSAAAEPWWNRALSSTTTLPSGNTGSSTFSKYASTTAALQAPSNTIEATSFPD
ncbi:hypothetical protein OH491_24825 [Termitidicoccus mucosus]